MLLAQAAATISQAGSATSGIGAVSGFVTGGNPFGPGFPGQPYSLTQKTSRVQTLADGTHITRTQEERRMQDSRGRTRIEMSTDINGTPKLVMITIFDPIAHTWTHLTPPAKRADVQHMPEPKPPTPEQQARFAELRAKAQAAHGSQPAQQAATPRMSTETLPARTIAGVYAEGRRITRVIPAGGQEGNDRELRIVTEEWISPDLHVQLERTIDDPRMGKSTMEVTSLERVEPDPALFQIPSDYTVVDKSMTQNQP